MAYWTQLTNLTRVFLNVIKVNWSSGSTKPPNNDPHKYAPLLVITAEQRDFLHSDAQGDRVLANSDILFFLCRSKSEPESRLTTSNKVTLNLIIINRPHSHTSNLDE